MHAYVTMQAWKVPIALLLTLLTLLGPMLQAVHKHIPSPSLNCLVLFRYKFTKQADALLTFDMCSSNICKLAALCTLTFAFNKHAL